MPDINEQSETQNQVLGLTAVTVSEWHRKNESVCQALSDVVATTISALLKSESIDYLAVSARVKSLSSLTEKVERKAYQDIAEVTDMIGVRVITYIESDVQKVCNLIEKSFQVHPDKSTDKSKEMQSNEIGYRSVHYVCELGAARISLPELTQFKTLRFEIQVRTVLQHAWAEIEHDRSYKFTGELPSLIKRRLNLLAGCLEIVDREFDALAQELDKHESESRKATESGNLDNVELTSTSLSQYTQGRKEISELLSPVANRDDWATILFQELKDFGIENLDDFDKIISPSFLEAFKIHIVNEQTNGTRFARTAMMYNDFEKYIKNSWKENWRAMPESMFHLLAEKYGKSAIISAFRENGIMTMSPDGSRKIYRNKPKSSENTGEQKK